ncbi:MAG: hypothetical protein KGY61_02035 [Desulfobacterales bacterium]|nr:hypothetical protein [Desulfobacterales bacterium]
MKPDPKKAAAISAVAAYIKSGEEAALSAESEPAEAVAVQSPAAEGPAPAMAVWALSGRQQQMQMRNLMQMKALQRSAHWRG